MSHFYGRVRGQAVSEATRQGGKLSGVMVTAETYEASVEVRLWHYREEDWCSIYTKVNGKELLIYKGRLADAADADKAYQPIAERLIKAG